MNLAPADLLKEGSHFDLPIAVAVLAAMGVLPSDMVDDYCALGELALDARIMPVPGVLPAALAASASERGLICPSAQGGEAAWAGIGVLAPDSLLALVNHFKGTQISTLLGALSRNAMKHTSACFSQALYHILCPKAFHWLSHRAV